ncbi:MAG: type II toxin-antitoxin system RelE/ParE family toxin [Alphaproteobacteria bacterium]|nr:type II toxin-antitoxin system RelE/ParE family toxin [Alphaproteobacteria bacterium]
MTKKYIISEQAQQDMEDIWWYIAQDNPVAADKTSDAIYEAYSLLAEHPYMGHVRKDITRSSLRFWAVYDYLIIYDPRSEPLRVVHVLSGSRDLEPLLDDEL